MVHVHTLSLLGIPDLLRNCLAKACVDFEVRKFQLLIDLIEVLAIKNHEDVSLGKHPLLELVVEFVVSCA